MYCFFFVFQIDYSRVQSYYTTIWWQNEEVVVVPANNTLSRRSVSRITTNEEVVVVPANNTTLQKIGIKNILHRSGSRIHSRFWTRSDDETDNDSTGTYTIRSFIYLIGLIPRNVSFPIRERRTNNFL